jgi:hypothetical protein
MKEIADGIFLWCFIKLASLWFGDVAFTSCPKTDRVQTMIFSSRAGTVGKIFEYMQKENIL